VPLARQIAGILGTDHRMRTIGRGEFLEVRDALLAAMDLPTIDGANTYFISMMAHEFGLKVALSGVGGDEFFGGYSGFSQIPRTVRSLAALSRMPAALGTAFRLVSAPLLRRTVSPKYASLLEYGPTYGGAYLLRRGLFMPWELPSLIDADMAREGWAELQSLPMLERMQSRITEGRTRVMALEIAMYMRCQLLRQTDWASMAHSLEVRTPLVDSVLFEALAPALVGPSPIVKRDLAAVAGDRICDLIQDRPKTGFSVPTSWYGGSPEDHGRGGAFRHWARHVYQHSTR
jgi:asparagine synthase (glutamine-hydrolysing)